MGTWEPFVSMRGTHWEHEKKQKIPCPPAPQEKNWILVEGTPPIAGENLLLLWICYLGQFEEVEGKENGTF